MEQDWLFALPRADFDDQEQILAQWLAADPAAAAISDQEAETFVAAGLLLRFMNRNLAARLWVALGVKVSHSGEKAWRRAVIMALRRWTEPKSRDLLTRLIPNTGFGPYPDPAEQGARWTEEFFAEAYAGGLHIIWLAQIRRYLGRDENLSEWMQGLGPNAERFYRLWLDIGRLTLRRVVYPQEEAAPKRQAVPTEPTELAVKLQKKDRLSGALRQDLRRLEQDRKRLKQEVRGAERNARALLAQAQGEVAAARRALKERQAAQERELVDQARQFETERTHLHERIAAARADFVRTLSDMATHSHFDVLQGRTVTVAGSEGDWEPYRLLVESIGGRLVPAGGNLVFPAPTGFTALERALRNLAMERVLILCDGLYRKREGRPGIAISGIQVQLGAAKVYWYSDVTCCGPSAGSLMAEYGAAAMALSWILAAGPTPQMKVEIWSDCRTLISWIRRDRIHRRKLGCVMLHSTVRRVMKRLREQGCDVRFRWVPRDEVHVVDRLCARSYRDLTWFHRTPGRPTARLKAFLRSTLQLNRYGPRRQLAEPGRQKDLQSVI